MLRRSFPSLVALLALATTQACGAAGTPSNDEESSAAGSASSSGTPSAAGTGSTGGAGATGTAGGSSPAGSPGGGVSSTGGAPATGGAGGPTTGGGASIGGGGAAGSNVSGGGGAGAATATQFGEVTSLLAKRCTGSKCHGNGSSQLAFASATGSALHSLLTSPIPSAVPHCVGVTLVTPSNASSPLLQILMSGGKIACTQPKTESVGPMPDKCTTTATSATGVCLTTAEIKVISDWISAGAPS